MNNIEINASCKKSRKIKVYKNFEFCDGGGRRFVTK